MIIIYYGILVTEHKELDAFYLIVNALHGSISSIEGKVQAALQSRRDNQDALRAKTAEIDKIIQRLEQLVC